MKSSSSHFIVVAPPSPPSRGAWIEIAWEKGCNENHNVAPLAGGVD